MSKRRTLGRGLASLIPDAAGNEMEGGPRAALAAGAVVHIPIDEVRANPFQPRRYFAEEPLEELIASIKEKGVIQPILLRPVDGGYEIVAGERRYRASCAAGLRTIPSIVRRMGSTESLELALIENLQREDLNPVEEAEAYKQLIEDVGYTQEELARKVGKDRSTVANMLRLLKLPEQVLDGLVRGALTMGHGRALLGLKLAAVVVLAGLGHRQRHRLASEADLGGRTRFWRVLALEAAILLGAAGTGVALTRTAPPAPSGSPRPLTAAEAMLGSSLPPPLDAGAWWSGWSIDSLFLPFGLAAAVWYVLAVRRLATRGVRWPWWRTALWLTGCVLFLWATNGPPGTYGRVLFSMHMIQHMTIATAVPVFLVLGAPVTLALRTLRRRDDGSRGLREWLLQTVHSLPAQLLGHPIVASALFVVSMVAFYYSSLFELSLETHTGHVLMTLHFLLSGYLFAECLVGIDPGLRRPTYPIRTLLVMVTFGFHALFSVSLMASTRVLAEEWYAALGRTWGDSLADDQYLGASLGWLLGEYPLAVIAVALLVSWVSADRRERRRFDRSEAREGDRQLHAYNAYLAGLSARTDTMQPSQSTAVLGTAEEADRS